MTYGYRFTFKINDGFLTIEGTGHHTRNQADEAFARHLKNCNYRAPRWWQIHRWGEYKPRREVIKILRSKSEWV